MKRIVLETMLVLSCAAVHAENTEYLLDVIEMKNPQIRTYDADSTQQKIEFATPVLTERAAIRQFNRITNRLDKHYRYTRLNGDRRCQLFMQKKLFMEDEDIDRTVLVARVRCLDGYRVIVAYGAIKNEN